MQISQLEDAASKGFDAIFLILRIPRVNVRAWKLYTTRVFPSSM
ncbi:MAG: hypothetical protein ACLUOI_21440 [Eisenbergiella sp.]